MHGHERPLRVVALGDSTLTGPGLEHDGHVWLRQALDRLEHHRPVELTSLAVGGARVADAVERIDRAVELRPDIVVVAVGANDALHSVAVRRIRRDFDRLVSGLLDGVDVVAVANVGDLGNIARIPRPLSNVVRMRSAVIRSVIESVVAAHDAAVLLDVTASNEAFRDSRIFTPDLFHPSRVGHAVWADAVLPDLRTAVERVA